MYSSRSFRTAVVVPQEREEEGEYVAWVKGRHPSAGTSSDAAVLTAVYRRCADCDGISPRKHADTVMSGTSME